MANFALTGYYTLLVLFLVRDLGLDPGRVGAVLAAGSVGGLVGAGVVAANVLRGTFRMRYTPPELLARTTSTSSLVTFGTMPLAGLAAGWLGTHVGVRETVTAMALVYTASAFAPLVGPYARIRDLPDQPMATWSNGSTATARNTTVT